LHCGCADCTDEIRNRDASNAEVTATCGDRIDWLQSPDGGSSSETEACAIVAGASSEFAARCGPQCDPSRCDDQVKDGAQPLCAGAVTSSSFEHANNVWVLDAATMDTATIKSIFDCLLDQQVNNEMGAERYAVYFLPGTYGTVAEPLNVLIGYYTEVAGLGKSPEDVVIHGKIEVYNRCFVPNIYEAGEFVPGSYETGATCFALNNFWRALSNLSINIVHQPGTDECRQTAMFYAISQASSMRRVDLKGGDLSLMDYCTGK